MSRSSQTLLQGKHYSVVKFPDDKDCLAIVVNKWISYVNGNYVTLWPPYKDSSKLKRAITGRVDPQPNWKIFKINIVFQTRNYGKAESKLEEYKIYSDVGELSVDTDVSMQPVDADMEDEFRIYSGNDMTPRHNYTSTPRVSAGKCDTCVEIKEILKKLMESHARLHQKCDNNFLVIQKMFPHHQTVSDLDEPAASLDDLRTLNEKLQSEEFFADTAFTLGLLGGKDTADGVRRILTRIISNKLATEMNWVGGRKRSIQEFPSVLKLILGSLRSNKLFEKTQQNVVEDVVKRWLRSAGDRDGGRSRRMKRSIQAEQLAEENIL